MKRRTVIMLGAGAAGAVIGGWSILPPRQRIVGSKPLPVSGGEIALNGWLRLAPDSSVTLMMPKSEMGQGVHTALAMIVAEELDCGWTNIRIEQSPIDKIFGNVASFSESLPFRPEDEGVVARTARWFTTKLTRELGVMMTGGSSSIRDVWVPLREACAIVRASLVNTAAMHWGVDAHDVSVLDGRISGPAGKSITFGEAVHQFGASLRPAGTWRLKDPAEFRMIGRSMPRLDSKTKSRGMAQFGIDCIQPGTLYAAVRMSPVLGAGVKSFDASHAQSLPGVKRVVSFPPRAGGSGGIAVIADSYWHAVKALSSVQTVWDGAPAGSLSTDAMYSQLHEAAAKKGGFTYWRAGDVDSALRSAAKTVLAEYRAPFLAHLPMEPANCVIEAKESEATIWISTQVPTFVRDGVAKELGLPEDSVHVNIPYLGGGFGRRLEMDVAVQAAAIAKQMRGVPIQVLWSREEDTRHDFYRPACVSHFEGAVDGEGKLIAWRNHAAGQSVVTKWLPRNSSLPGVGPDKTTDEGAFDQPYEFPNAQIGFQTVELPVPVGFFRAVGHSHHAFFKEGFLDEMAAAASADPFEFRAALLKNHPRHLAVLKLAADKAGWGTPLPADPGSPRKARGIALHDSFNSIVSEVAEVSVASDGRIVVHRVVCAIDCGIPVNPGLISQQMESAIIFGLSMALYGDITIENGVVQQSNFHDYRVIRMHESPVIEVHIIPSTRAPEGVGEPGLPPLAPAIANAVFALTGQRLRTLPLALANAPASGA